MIVISMTNCPAKLRGDLSKWLMEINTGVYVGNVSARVREALWKRITDSLRDGQAVMVCSANNAQGMTCREHQPSRQPVDYDGYTLMKTPDPRTENPAEPYQSKEHFRHSGKRAARGKIALPADYVILDLETTGLSPFRDRITEIGIMVIRGGSIQTEKSWLLRNKAPIPPDNRELPGITDELCAEQGVSPADALDEVYDLIDGTEVISWHASFDLAFLEQAFEQNQFTLPDYHITDAETLVKKQISGLPNYKMETAAAHFGINTPQQHRALPDCQMLYGILLKLNENA